MVFKTLCFDEDLVVIDHAGVIVGCTYYNYCSKAVFVIEDQNTC